MESRRNSPRGPITPKKLAFKAVILILLALVVLPGQDSAYRAESLYGIAEPYNFTIFSWESQNLFNKWVYKLRELRPGNKLSKGEKVELIEEYFYSDAAKPADVENELEAIIEEQISEVLAKEGLCLGKGTVFPPVDFKRETLPHILVISPREKIELLGTVILQPDLSPEEVSNIEAEAEKLGVSALVERVGGISTYPSMIPEGRSLSATISTVAHEWTHHYLFFHPLGRHYGASCEMRTINETLADMMGDELSSRILLLYYGRKQEEKAEAEGAFDFNKEMREIRLTVDDYLESGEVEEAERFMEERRGFLQSRGYYIRKINQAYFAWHGTYADTPASTSPIGEELRLLRGRSASLGEFVKTVSRVSSYSDLEELLKKSG